MKGRIKRNTNRKKGEKKYGNMRKEKTKNGRIQDDAKEENRQREKYKNSRRTFDCGCALINKCNILL